ncbi:MAG: response regulator transcription factor, partial [Selenomonadaceae bacterium]|nr:response regulator transcription factor [Selenomonadaceae bacterium]
MSGRDGNSVIRVMIADDQELIRESLQIVLDINEDMQVVGVAQNGAELLELLEKQAADVILMDVRMPKMDGVQATKAVKKKYP